MKVNLYQLLGNISRACARGAALKKWVGPTQRASISGMASIQLLGGKKKLLTIQLAELVHLQRIARWPRLLRKNARPALAVVTSLGLLAFLFTHLHGMTLNSGRVLPDDSGSYYEGVVAWVPPPSCQDCSLSRAIDLGLLQPHLLLVLVHSKVDGRKRRDTIRHTWLSDFRGLPNPPIQYKFVVGADGQRLNLAKQLFAEAEQFSDMIILDNVDDSPASLATLTLDGFSFSLENYQFKYILKCDDDTFVDVLRVATELHRRQHHTRFYWGFMTGNSAVHSHGHYGEQTLCERYLPHAAGGGYVISRDLAELLAVNKDYLMRYSYEDVSMGAWLAPYNIERCHDTRFNTEAHSRGCKSVFLVSHKTLPEDMHQLYESLKLDGTFCAGKTEWYGHDGFIYNWTSSPSHCCRRIYGIP